MRRLAILLAAVALWSVSDADAKAQVYVSYYQPAPVFAPAPVYYSSYYAPAPAVVAAPAPVYQPVTRVRTRYRPFLGGTVTRVRTGYAPAYYAPAPVVYAY